MHRGSDRSGDGGGGGRYSRGPSRWSSSGDSGRFAGGGGGGGGRFHPYRGPPDYAHPGGVGGGGGGGIRSGGGGGSGGEFGGPAMPMPPGTGPRHRFSGRGGSPEHDNRTSYIKLFIGSVPRTATEEDVRPLFEEHGDVLEVALIKDRKTGEQQGCCFVKYATSEEAERAIRALHNQYTLPGAAGPIQVRYADGERERHGALEHKLFVASLNKQATVKEIEEIFAPYGHVEDVYIMKDGMRQSRGCGFVKFSTREMAAAAMNALNGTYVMRGCEQPLIVRFADPKRPRPGESRGGPAFGGPGFSPRSDAALVIRPTANLDEPRGRRMPPDSWHPSSPRSLGPSQFNNFGSDNLLAPKGGAVTTSSDTAGVFRPPVFPANGSMPSHSVVPSSHLGVNPSMAQVHPMGGQQISPMQKPLVAPQNFLPLQLQNAQQMPAPNSQAQALQAPLQQLGQLQAPQSMGLGTFGQNLPSLQLPGLGGQLPTSQPLMQPNPTGGPLQASLAVQPNPMPAVAGQQQPPSNVAPQLLQQPMQQMPSQVPPMLLQQQQQALQSSYQSSQQAILQLQQQLQLMQQQSNLNQQQAVQAPKQQSTLTGQPMTASTPAGAAAAVVPTNISSIPQQIAAPAVPLTCNWTEHTSPEGFKYYYNSITRESKWEKPEEFALYEQQQQLQQQQKLLLLQQQQKLAVQQLQSPPQAQSLAPMQHAQQVPQAQQGQMQLQMKQQPQLQLLQPSVSELNYNQLQSATSLDPSRIQQGIQAAQERAWKNKPAG